MSHVMRHSNSEKEMLALNVGYAFLHGEVDLMLSNNHGILVSIISVLL